MLYTSSFIIFIVLGYSSFSFSSQSAPCQYIFSPRPMASEQRTGPQSLGVIHRTLLTRGYIKQTDKTGKSPVKYWVPIEDKLIGLNITRDPELWLAGLKQALMADSGSFVSAQFFKQMIKKPTGQLDHMALETPYPSLFDFIWEQRQRASLYTMAEHLKVTLLPLFMRKTVHALLESKALFFHDRREIKSVRTGLLAKNTASYNKVLFELFTLAIERFANESQPGSVQRSAVESVIKQLMFAALNSSGLTGSKTLSSFRLQDVNEKIQFSHTHILLLTQMRLIRIIFDSGLISSKTNSIVYIRAHPIVKNYIDFLSHSRALTIGHKNQPLSPLAFYEAAYPDELTLVRSLLRGAEYNYGVIKSLIEFNARDHEILNDE